MRERKQIVCLYGGHRREACPAILGFTRKAEKALVFQFGGDSGSGLPPGGEWRCLSLAGVTVLELREGPWHAPSDNGPEQTCVADVEYDVNPASPYNPRFPL
jgi:hypothetical protein